MGTDSAAPLLASLVHLVRPRRVFEVGMGYTTPFLAAALADVEDQVRLESADVARKTMECLAEGGELDDRWLLAEPSLVAPQFHLDPYRPRLVALDDLSLEQSSAGAVQSVLEELALADRVTVVQANLRGCAQLLPKDLVPIDLAWVDAWDCLYFFDHFWSAIRPDGGLVVMHYLMTYPEGEAILRYISEHQRRNPGEVEILSILEPHKLTQNSITILRRTGGAVRRRFSAKRGRVSYDEALRTAAIAQADLGTQPA